MMLMNNNLVTLSGTITEEPRYSHQVFGEGFYESELKVSRLSEQSDYIPITVSDRLLQSASFSPGSAVSVTGQFRSYNKLLDGRSKLMLTVFVREVIEEDADINPNQIDLIGYICKEPIFRTTPFKREICDILIAVNRAYNKSDYIPCIAWGRNARFASTLDVGTKIAVSGRIQSREYQKQGEDGTITTRVAYEISISRLSLGDTDELCEDEEY
ncbi:MAG: single-stranded DNA-binding protein [Clostridia bacterium]